MHPNSSVASSSRTRAVAFAVLVVSALAATLALGPVPKAEASPPTPVATLNVPPTPFLGEPMAFTVSFDNTDTTDAGYGPYVDLYLPTNGADGAVSPPQDGISFVNATFFGAAVQSQVLVFPPGGTIIHPFTGATITGTPGDQFVVLTLPFGSFTPTQPVADITVNTTVSNLADVGTALPIKAVAGFRYGNSPTGGTPIVQSPATTASTTPTLVRLTKTCNCPEGETSTGPNFPRSYTVTADVAAGQTLTNLRLTDQIPNTLAYLGVSGISPAGSVTAQPAVGSVNNAPGNTVTVTFPTVTGGAGAGDATFTVNFFVARVDANSNAVIPALTGASTTVNNTAGGLYNWTPVDPRDPVVTNGVLNASSAVPLEQQSLSVRKSATKISAGAVAPGTVIEYTLDVDVSDYFAFGSVTLTDSFSDGQSLDPTFTPTFTRTQNGVTDPVTPFAPADWGPAVGTGPTAVPFRLSDALAATATGAKLLGGCVPAGGVVLPNCTAFNGGATRAQVKFRTVVDFTYDSGNPVIEGDTLSDTASVSGLNLRTSTLTSTGNTVTDDTAASVEFPKGVVAKSVYAVNGNTSPASPVQIGAGDTVTYRLSYTLPQSRQNGLTLEDFLPLPLFSATELTTVSAAAPSATPPAAGSASRGPTDTYTALSGSLPTLTTNATGNSASFTYPAYAAAPPQASVVDVLFTVTASGLPFVDGLLFTNQVRSTQIKTDGSTVQGNAIVQVDRTEPVLRISKGAIATSATGTPAATFTPAAVAPAANLPITAPGTVGKRYVGTISSSGLATTPINSNLANIDAGDLVTFAVVVENTGRGLNGAFDVQLRDVLPAGFAVPGSGAGLNFRVQDGTGAVMPFTNLGTGYFDPAGGIQLTDPGPTNPPPGSIDGCNKPTAASPCLDTSGQNLAVVTYDLVATSAVQPNQILTNTATLFRYQGCTGSPSCVNYLDPTGSSPTPLSDTATVQIRNVGAAKSLVTTSEASTTGANVAVGEIARYRVQIRVPEGSATNFQITDAIPAGLTYLNDGTTKIAFVSTTAAGGFVSSTITPASTGCTAAALNPAGNETTVAAIAPTCVLPAAAITPAVFNNGDDPTFSLGDTTISPENDTNQEFVVVEYNALVGNVVGNQAGTALANNASVSVGGTVLTTSGNNTVTVREPGATFLKCQQSDPANCSTRTTPTADAGDVVSFRLVFAQAAGGNRINAFDVRVLDALDTTKYTLVPGSVVITTSGTVGTTTDSTAGDTVDVTAASVAPASSLTVEYQATVVSSIEGGTYTNANTARSTFTSLPGTNGTSPNPTGSVTPGGPGSATGERTGADGPGGALNDYAINSSRDLIVPTTATKTVVATSEADTVAVAGVDRVAIGEIVRYRLVSRVPEGTTPSLEMTDNIPSGMSYVNGSAKVALVAGVPMTSADPTFSPPSTTAVGLCPVGPCPGVQVVGDESTINTVVPTVALPASNVSGGTGSPVWGNSSDPIFALGNVTNADRDVNQEFIVLEYNVLVRNQASNATGTTLSNSYVFRKRTAAATTVNLSGPAVAPVVVAEPAITFAKTTDLVVQPDLNDPFNYTITITNGTGANVSPAYDTRVRDAVPAQLTVSGALTITPAGGAATITNNTVGNAIDVLIGLLPPGGSVTLNVPVTVSGPVAPGQIITNNATAGWTSLPGTNGTNPNPTGFVTPGAPGTATGERTCSSPLVAPNGYCAASNVPVTIGTAALTKSVFATDEPQTTGTDVVPGETVTYDVGVTLPEGTTGAFTVTDAIPANMSYVGASASIVTSGPPLSQPLNGTVTPAATFVTGGATSGAAVTFNFTGASLVGDNDPANNTFVIRYKVLVDQNAANTNGLVKTNTATISLPGAGSASTTVTVRRVDLAIAKSDGGISVGPAQTIPYTLSYQNKGGVVADGVVITETVPAGTVFRTALSTAGWSCADGSPATNLCTFAVGTVLPGGTGSVVFGLAPLPPFTSPYLVSNTTTISDNGASWVDANPADNVASDTTPLLQAYDNADVTDVNTPKIINVLGNDVGFNPLVVTGSTPSQAGGTTVVNGNNTITYTPPLDYTGYDVFHYSITDGLGGTDTATVVIFIDADNVRKNDRMFFTAIGGTTPCTAPCATPGTYERINVGAPVVLKAQELVITLRPGFFPTAGQTFDVFTAPSVTGEFGKVYGQVQYDPTTKQMIVFEVRVLPTKVQLVATKSCPITSTADGADATPGDGVCADAQGRATLRSAVMEAASGSLGSRVGLVLPTGAYALTLPGAGAGGGDLDVATGTDLVGNGSAVAVSGAADRALELAGDNSVRGLAISAGTTTGAGGGVLVDGGAVALTDVAITGSNAASGGGLAVVAGSVTVNRGSISTNSATTGGGVLVNGGTLALAGTPVQTNHATALGGGLAVLSGSAALTGVTTSANTAVAGAGLFVGPGGQATMSSSTLGTNAATSTGGGFSAAGTLTLTDSRVTGNSAPSAAGGAAGFGSTLGIDRVTFDANVATTGAAGLDAAGTTTIATSTFSGNTAPNASALRISGGAATVRTTTITANSSSGGAGTGAVQVSAGTLGIRGSIVSDQLAGANCAAGSTVTSGGYNHANDTTCGLTATGDVQTGSANLGLLKANGGYSPTHQPNLGSPVVNSGDPTCTGQDQRGWLRPRNGVCEKGSVER